jgi:uncharacterized protein with NRDE domain
MCVVALAWRPSGWAGLATDANGGPHLVVIGNRDEFHLRPAAPLDVLTDCNDLPVVGSGPTSTTRATLVGGRDLEKRGGWLWASSSGRLATVTNVRSVRSIASPPAADAAMALRSRGDLVAWFVAGQCSVPEALADLSTRAHAYGRFNLFLFDGTTLGYASNVPRYSDILLGPGVYALSNGSLDSRWPKAVRVQRALENWLPQAAVRPQMEPLFAALRDDHPVADAGLPDTGLGLATERLLATPFVRATSYGTRCSSVVVMNRDELTFAERRFAADGSPTGDTVLVIPRDGFTVASQPR